MMRIETERLIIRNFTPGDADDLYEIFGDAETMTNVEPPYDLEETRGFLESFCIEKGGALAAAEREGGRVIGYILFNEFDEGVYELGWIFNRAYWRRGYAYEACSSLIEHAFTELGAHKLFAEAIDAAKSVGLMEKLGMKPEGVQHGQTKNNAGEWCDLYLYGILEEDFNALQQRF